MPGRSRAIRPDFPIGYTYAKFSLECNHMRLFTLNPETQTPTRRSDTPDRHMLTSTVNFPFLQHHSKSILPASRAIFYHPPPIKSSPYATEFDKLN